MRSMRDCSWGGYVGDASCDELDELEAQSLLSPTLDLGAD